jgi:hypothetical protein
VRCLLPLPATLTADRVRIEGGVRADPAINPVRVVWAYPAAGLAAAHTADPGLVSQHDVDVFGAQPHPDTLLVVRTSSSGDFSTYRFVIDDPETFGFDPRLASTPFSFKVDCPGDFDCATVPDCPPERALEPVIDYLSRDYAGLRQTLLDRLSLTLPGWTDRSPADLGIALVELFAYLGDQLAYAQDAVAAEAYLGTARRRVSVRRHARLLDYPMHDGAAARAWLALSATPGGDGTVVDAGHEVAASDGSQAFHMLHPVTVREARNAVFFYTWGDLRCVLPAGATGATLRGTRAGLRLAAGDVLILEEVRGGTGVPADADPGHRYAVRLVADPVDLTDPLTGADLVDVRWAPADAPAGPLCLDRFPPRPEDTDVDADGLVGAAVVRGNVVLAEHGALVGPEPLVPAEVPPGTARYRPQLQRLGLAHAVPYDHATAVQVPAAQAAAVTPGAAVPAVVTLSDGRDTWTVRRDLLGSDRFAAEFVVESDDDGRAFLRFGDDVLGRRPAAGTTFSAAYRIGGGVAGNVGRDSLTVLDPPVPGIAVRNPVAAGGGADPEPVEQVRQWAPQAFRVQQRAVTDADYAEVTGRHPQVQRAAATRRWTGSWYTEFVTVDRTGGAPVDAGFRGEIAGFIERYRMAGYDVEVDAPVFVPLDIVFTVCVEPGYVRAAVKQALLRVFSNQDLPDGGRGFFHPDNFTFAQSVYLSRIVAAAMAVDGVSWVDTSVGPDSPHRFQRWGRESAGERAAGRITLRRLEVARCDSDPNEPENGRIDFLMAGGL